MAGDDVRNEIASTVSGPVVQAGTIVGNVSFHQGAPSAPEERRDPWVRAAIESTVWQHVPAERDLAAIRSRVESLVAAFARLRAESERTLAADPWLDSGVALRFVEKIEWLLAEPGQGQPLDLYPAEAGLLVLIPFLYRTHCLAMATRYLPVNPANLNAAADASADRVSFVDFVEKHGTLATRAALHPVAEAPIGWWLFHRWLIQHDDFGAEEAIQALLDSAGEAATALGDVVASARLSKLLHGLHRGPGVCNREYLDTLRADDRVRGPGQQRVREQRLALLLTLAYGTCVEMRALPHIVAEHLGIPHPVDPALLTDTLEHLSWGGSPDLPVLRARCHHEAVIEALREYTARVDELLHGINRTVRERITQPMPTLPTRLSANEVTPADGVFTGWASFRLDEHRVRDLVMGVALYKDPDLAVRELYQNALDACRYRRARTEYLDRTSPAAHSYAGKITFEQATDEHGREYLECHDNGIGMGDAELRGVFCNAGARFAEQPDFKLERAAWSRLTPPIPMYPNSRFGIGVLSYFMLADEIEVTTCRMGLDGTPGPLLRASIFGPGHLFRITTLADRGTNPGTRVRLYLRADLGNERPWSSVAVLERLLGIAEFPTTAQDGKRQSVWPVGELRRRMDPPRTGYKRELGLTARGALVPWQQAPTGAQVVWCGEGGNLLVDGLVVVPAIRNGVLGPGDTGLDGVVVNLSGELAPNRLSADRRHVLDDVSDQVADLLAQASGALDADTELFTYNWICGIADKSPRLGDLVTKRAIEVGLRLFGKSRPDATRTGCFPADSNLVRDVDRHENSTKYELSFGGIGSALDDLVLWRLLAHGSTADLQRLAEIYPEIETHGEVAPAIPSDLTIFTTDLWGLWSTSQSIAHNASKLGSTWREVAERAAMFGIQILQPEGLADSLVRSRTFDAVLNENGEFMLPAQRATVAATVAAATRTGMAVADLIAFWRGEGIAVSEAVAKIALAAESLEPLVADSGEPQDYWSGLEPGDTVPPGHIAHASRTFGMTVADVCARLSRYGLIGDPGGLPDRPTAETVVLLSRDLDGAVPWLVRTDPVSPYHIIAAARAFSVPFTQILEQLNQLGFRTPARFPVNAGFHDRQLLKLGPRLAIIPPVHMNYEYIFDVAASQQRPLGQIVERLIEYGFDIPLRIPTRLTELDKQLLTNDGPLDWHVPIDAAMPFPNILIAARSLNRSPGSLVLRLGTYGIRSSCQRLPAGLSFITALQLITALPTSGRFLSAGSTLSVSELLTLSNKVDAPISRVVGWLREMGVHVPDVADMIRASLARVPRTR